MSAKTILTQDVRSQEGSRNSGLTAPVACVSDASDRPAGEKGLIESSLVT